MHQIKNGQVPRRRSLYPTLVLLAFLAVVVFGLLPGSGLFETRPFMQNGAPRLIPNTDVNPYGANFFLEREAERWKIDKTLDMAASAGLGWVKQQFPWESLEVSEGNFLDNHNELTWDKYDYIVNTAARYGLQVIARLDRPPAWAREEGSLATAPPRDYEAFGRFVYRVAEHFRGRVRYYQIWNEPNLTEEWGGRPVDPKGYVELLKVAYTAIKQADPGAYVLSAPLAQTLENNPAHMSDIAFLEEMYRHGAADYFDILFANAYGFSLPPEDPPSPDKLNFQRVLLLREVMERNGDGDKAVWFNEFGWNASPPDMPAEDLWWGRVSDQEQAEYTIRAVEMARREWPWAGVFNIWFFRQDGHIPPDDSQYFFRVVDTGFTPRPLYHALRKATEPLKFAGPGQYQETSSAVRTAGGWQVQIDPTASGKALLASENPGDTLTFNFTGGGLTLLARTGPDGGRVYVTLDNNGVPGLPRDSAGRAYVDLYSPTPNHQAMLVLAQGVRAGPHTVELTVAAEHDPSSTGRLVVIDGFEVHEGSGLPWLEIALILAAVAIVVVLIWRRRRAAGKPAQLSGSRA